MKKEIKQILDLIENTVDGVTGRFTILKVNTPETIKTLQQPQKVMDVMEYNEMSIVGKYKAWIGSTESNYFSIMYAQGVVTVSINEREMLIGSNIITYAMLTKLIRASEQPDSEKIYDEYYKNKYDDELKTITFEEIMKLLNWTYFSPKVKIKEGIIFTT